ncbi:MAG: homoserine dehydrogenase [Propionibacteriaceae bacterium]|jgi:homoserine dehydrogenase|nr:homoserine dehydrogenase [Propionibacteriaceae bacterium]
MTKNYNIALVGLGNVNRTLADIIQAKGSELAEELGFTLRVTAITDWRFGTLVDPAGVDLAAVLAMRPDDTFVALGGTVPAEGSDNEEFIRTAPADIVAEATFTNPVTGEPALSHVRWALEAGKSVCTTNKGPVAFAVDELKALAADNAVRFEFEGAVMSGTPVIRLASGPLKGVGMKGFSGILNGTSNYILGRMEAGLSQLAAIEEAQDYGYAEADPTADIGGSDVRLKVMVLASQVLGVELASEDVPTEGITAITPQMISDAVGQGKHWKLIGQASKDADGRVTAQVAPQLLDASHPLAAIPGATNAVMFDTEYLGPVTISGPGAGRIETAYALLSDIIAIDAALA